METLNLYQNNVAYDFDMFTAKPIRDTEAPVIDYPVSREHERVRKQRKANALRDNVIRCTIIVAIIAALFANIFSRAAYSQVEMQITKQESAITKLDSEITRLNCELQSLLTYEKIDQKALELGMQKLERSQITYIYTDETED